MGNLRRVIREARRRHQADPLKACIKLETGPAIVRRNPSIPSEAEPNKVWVKTKMHGVD